MNTCPNCKYKFRILQKIKNNIVNNNFIVCPHCNSLLKEWVGLKPLHFIIGISPWFFIGLFIEWLDGVLCNIVVSTTVIVGILVILNVIMFILSPFWSIFEKVEDIKSNN